MSKLIKSANNSTLADRIKESQESLNTFIQKVNSKQKFTNTSSSETHFQQLEDIAQSKELYPQVENLTYYEVRQIQSVMKECSDKLEFQQQKIKQLQNENTLGGLDIKITEQIQKIKSIDDKNIKEKEKEQVILKELQQRLKQLFEQRKNEIDQYTGILADFDVEIVK